MQPVLTPADIEDARQSQALAARKAIDDELVRTHLVGVEDDHAAGFGLRVERARLVLYGSLAAMAAVGTAVWTGTRPVCVAPLGIAVALLFWGATLAWIALQWGENEKGRRVLTKYANLAYGREAVFGDDQAKRDRLDRERKDASDAELRAANVTRYCAVVAQTFSALGVSALIWTAGLTLTGAACWTWRGPWTWWLG